jgi:hypothetical protein
VWEREFFQRRIYDRVWFPKFMLGVDGLVVVKKIRADPVRFDDATLGRTVDEYCSWIARPNMSFPPSPVERE